MAGWTISNNRAYIGEHEDIFLSPSKKDSGLYKRYERTVVRPLFLSYKDADLSCYEGFLKLIDITGLTGFVYLDEDSEYEYPIGAELKKNLITKGFIKGFYTRHKDTLQDDQDSIKLFYEWFVEGKQPIIYNPTPEIENLLVFTINHYQKELQFKPRDKNESKSIQEANKIIESLQRHIHSVKLIAITHPFPIQDKMFDMIMKIGMKEILSGDRNKFSKLSQALTAYDSRKAYRKYISIARRCTTLPSLCYLEMLDLLEDEKEFRKCSNCGELFIPVHDREIFCNRVAPEFKHQGRLTTAEEWKSIFKKTCKKIGPQKKFNKTLSPEDKETIKKDKQFRSRLDYLKKIGNDVEYKKVQKDFNKWKKQVNKKGGSNHGTEKQ